MRIAPDVEQLMWIAAESGDPNAIEDFGARFPHLRYELSKRIDMVRKLKQSGKMAIPSGSIPRFTPPHRIGARLGPRFRWSVAALALSALAFGSFFGTKYLASKEEAPPLGAPRQTIPAYSPQESTEERIQEPPPVRETQSEVGVVTPDDEPAPVDPWQKLKDVKFERIGLATAIKAIAAQSGMNLEMPPDMPNDDIVVDYRNMTGIEILHDMASRFAFTVFDQGNGKVLVVPARDPDRIQDGRFRGRQPDSSRKQVEIHRIETPDP